ncbi:Astra associated protein 1 Asa1 [Coemansia thaxteri]|uniref:ASTRA-associated protein 1 n=1 Tax=Coemansia thaxteri TaxID=2663907 RepID=A0A9W8BK80_9FUNG|nr:Astra associated protein 1 Asa1 [Coemansia thaxteri]KAJ2480877.1 Astra associated protein 1 Asa1 [Coemansia sp. RSA 2320]
MLQPDFVFRGHHAAVNSVCFFGDDRYLVSADQDGHLIVWNMMLKRQLAKQSEAHSAPILSVCGLGSNTVVSQGRDNKLNIWLLSAGEFSGDLALVNSLPADSMTFCKFSHLRHLDTLWIAFLESAGAGDLCLYSVSTGVQHKLSIGRKSNTKAGIREDPPMCIRLAATGEESRLVLFVGYESTVLQQFDIVPSAEGGAMTAVVARSVTTAHSEPIMSLDYDCQRRLVYTCAADNRVCCYTEDGSTFKEHVHLAELQNAGCAEIRCYPELALVAVAGWDYAVHLFDSSLKPVSNIAFHRSALTSIDVSLQSSAGAEDVSSDFVRQRWSSRCRWLVAASRDSRISLWDVGRLAPSPAAASAEDE